MHVIRVGSKIAPAVGVLRRFREFLPRRILILLYYAFIFSSRLQYVLNVWDSSAAIQIDKLWVVQKRDLKFIYNLPVTFSTETLFGTVSRGCLTLQQAHTVSIGTLMFGITK
jgi:hypothetical protein